MSRQGKKTAAQAPRTGIPIRTQRGAAAARTWMEKRLECMQASMLLRADSRFFLDRHPCNER